MTGWVGFLPFALLRLQKTQRAASMVEMARRMCERQGSGVICHGVSVPWLGGVRPPSFNHGSSYQQLPHDQANFLREEIGILTEKGAFRPVASSRCVSRAFLVPKPGGWRLIIELRAINKQCHKRSMKMETLRRLRYIAKPNDYFVSFDLKDGFYALSIHPKDREAFTVNLDG